MPTTSNKKFVEDCIILDSKKLKGVFAQIRKKKYINDMFTTNKGSVVYFWPEYEADTFLTVSVVNNEPQKIVLTTLYLRYGERTLFRCECGYRAAKLFLPSNGTEFKCRSCWNLRYKVSNFNRNNKVDQLGKEMDLNDKLRNAILSTKRPLYKGMLTKRAIRIERLKYKANNIRRKHENRNSKREIISNWNRQRSKCI